MLHTACFSWSFIACLAPLTAQVAWTEFPARTSAAVSEDSSGPAPRLVVFGGMSLEGTMLNDTQVLNTTAASPSWQPLSTTSTPPPTKAHAMANLPPIGVVMFGGQTDATTLTAATWIFHGDSWSQLGSGIAPTPRIGHAMALDESRNRIVMYGGRDANNTYLTDTWEFDGTNWTQIFPPTSPGPMFVGHSMAFQPATNTVIAVQSSWGPYRPAWRYDGTTGTWTSLPGPNAIGGFPQGWRVVRCPSSNTVAVIGGADDAPVPPQKLVGNTWVFMPVMPYHRISANTIYDQASDRVYLYGGVTSAWYAAHTTIVWDGTTATLLADDSDPDGRYGQAVISNPQDGNLYLLGGNSSDVSYYGYSPFEMWYRTAGRWQRLTPPQNPARLLGATYDQQRGRMVVLSSDGTWEWNGSTWVQVTTTGPGDSCIGMVFDAHRSRTVVRRRPGTLWQPLPNETWEWDGIAWTQRFPAQSPPDRDATAMAYDPVSQSTLLFGGDHFNGSTHVSMNDTWKWDGTNWTQVPTASTPPPGVWLMANDPLRQRIVIASQSGTWEWDGSNWLQRTPIGAPPPDGAMAFDPVTNKIVAFANSGSTFEYGPINPAIAVSFGPGCPGSGPPRAVNATRLPWLNDIARFTVDMAPSPSIGLLGFSNTTWSGIPLPADLTLAGMPNCNLYTSLDWIEFLPQSTWNVPIPPLPGSVGLQFYVQALVPDAGAGNPFLATMSNAIVNVIGEK